MAHPLRYEQHGLGASQPALPPLVVLSVAAPFSRGVLPIHSRHCPATKGSRLGFAPALRGPNPKTQIDRERMQRMQPEPSRTHPERSLASGRCQSGQQGISRLVLAPLRVRRVSTIRGSRHSSHASGKMDKRRAQVPFVRVVRNALFLCSPHSLTLLLLLCRSGDGHWDERVSPHAAWAACCLQLEQATDVLRLACTGIQISLVRAC